jgi:P4 family phage/plasmid primase-like protien
LKGERAENGKSQILDMMRGLLPLSAISSVTATRMGDERHIVGLVGKLLNASDELSGSAAISSDTFKAIITGEPVSGRDVYKSRVEFRSQAQHVFAANTLPSFQGGMDRGVQRRLVVISFNCVIPKENRIENIGKRIAEEEPDLLLAWAVEGASRLIKQRNFTMPQSSKEALSDWLFSADSVQAWFQESIVLIEKNGDYPHLKTNYAYSHYKNWAETEGYRKEQILGINGFVQRMKTMEHIHYKRKMDGAIFIGMNIKRESVVETSAPDPQNKYYETQVIK